MKYIDQIKNKLQDAWQRAFPKTISGAVIDLSKDSGVFASIKHVAKFNNDENAWDVFVRHTRQSRGTTCLVSRNEIKLATLSKEDAAKEWLNENADQLKSHAESYLLKMGYENPKRSYPVLSV